MQADCSSGRLESSTSSPRMVTETQELMVFNTVAKHASYARAAHELSLSPSGVSKIITRLEERLGARLVQRTTRKLSLTEAGTAFHARTSQILVDLADAEAEVQKTALRPKGTLKVSASVAFGQLYLAPMLGELLHQFPELSIDLALTNRFVDLIEEGVDLAVRIGSLTDSRLVARRLCTNRRILVASPAYIERCGMPQSPDDLAHHQCVIFNGFPKPLEWKLLGPGGPVSVTIAGRVATNDVATLTNAAKQGLGITVGATQSVGPALLSGDFVRVLSDYEFEPTAVFAVYTSARQLSTKIRAAVDFLATKITDPPSWDQSLRGKVPGF
jgi:DNA-binding transcriptional LysR family regulator